MGKLIKGLLIFAIVAVILFVLFAAAVLGIVLHLTKETPMEEYPYMQDSANIVEIELAEVDNLGGNMPIWRTVDTVEDIEAFLADFEALKCRGGLNIKVDFDFEKDTLRVIKFTYSDGAYEIVSMIGNADSTMADSDDIKDIFSDRLCSFNQADFDALYEKYLTE